MSTDALKLCGTADTVDMVISIDGTWQRKGFTLMNRYYHSFKIL